jgi:TonB family protein
VALPGLFLILALPPPAFGAWRERPKRDQVVTFARGVDSVVVLSLELADSATAGKRFGVEQMDVAGVRQRVVKDRAWGLEFLETILRDWDAQRACAFDLIRTSRDSAEVVVAFTEFRIGKEAMWIALSFPDSCAYIFLRQGPWNGVPLRENRAAVLRLLREAIPNEPMFAADAFPRRPPIAPGDAVNVSDLPESIKQMKPTYPASAREQGISGTVWVQALISKQGRVVDTRLAWSVSPLLDEAATDAVRHWEFKPAMDNGNPVAVWVIVPVKFRLP